MKASNKRSRNLPLDSLGGIKRWIGTTEMNPRSRREYIREVSFGPAVIEIQDRRKMWIAKPFLALISETDEVLDRRKVQDKCHGQAEPD
jgi:hypothetical protein